MKSAAAYYMLGFSAAGTPGMALQLKDEYIPMFADVHVIQMPDSDRKSRGNAVKNYKKLQGVAASVRIGTLPQEITETGGADVRDVLKSFGDRGPDSVRKAIEEARPAEEFTDDKEPAEPPSFVQLVTCARVSRPGLEAAIFDPQRVSRRTAGSVRRSIQDAENESLLRCRGKPWKWHAVSWPVCY